MSFVPVEEVVTFLRLPDLTSQQDLALLADILQGVEDWVASQVGPLDSAEVTYTERSNGRYIVLPATRLDSVVSVVDELGVPATPVHVDLLAGVIELRRHHRPATYTVVVTLRARSRAIAQAIKIITAHQWGTQRGAGAASVSSRLQVGGGFEAGTGMGFAIPNRAADMLAPFRLVGAA